MFHSYRQLQTQIVSTTPYIVTFQLNFFWISRSKVLELK